MQYAHCHVGVLGQGNQIVNEPTMCSNSVQIVGERDWRMN